MPVIYDFVYYICVNIFLENIRQSNAIKGIVIGEKELKTSAFSRDATYTGNKSYLAHLVFNILTLKQLSFLTKFT